MLVETVGGEVCGEEVPRGWRGRCVWGIYEESLG